MTKEWLKIVVAACFEVAWVIGLKHAESQLEWVVTIIAIIVSFYFMIMAGEKLPVGTVYAVFVGLGTAGTVVADILLFDAPIKLAKLLFIAILLIGVVGLKLSSGDQENKTEQETN